MVPYYFNTEENHNYVGPMPDISYYGVDEMSGGEREEFLEWYETRKSDLFDNRLVQMHTVRMTSRYYKPDVFFDASSFGSETLTFFSSR
jgi:hypothetical protein